LFGKQRRLDGISARYTAISRGDFAAQAKFYRRVLVIVLILAMIALYAPLGYPWWCAFVPAVCLAYDRQHVTTVAGKPPAGEMAADAVVGSILIAVHPAFLVPALMIMLTLTAIAAIGYGPRQGWVYAAPTIVLAPVAAFVSHPPYAAIAIVTFAICATFFVVVVAAIVRWDSLAQLKLAQFAEVVERLPVGVVVAEWTQPDQGPEELQIMSANLAAAALAGTTTGELIGATVERAFQNVVGAEVINDIQAGLNARRPVVLEDVREQTGRSHRSKSFVVRAESLENRLVSISFEDVTSAVILRENLHHAATHDALTGLPNRSLFEQILDEALKAAALSGGSVAVLVLDLDGFKEINDTWGHHQGDRCLVAFGERISTALHQRGVLARLGGDEFVVLLTGVSADNRGVVAEQLRRCLDTPLTLDGIEIDSCVSIGAAAYPTDAADAGTLLQLADVAMYADKRGDGADEMRRDRRQ
jgi:diguanylate cyclase (GGDEF)-like protein